MSADPAHRAADPARSAWVGANAGSGKTYILVTRLVRLMLAGVAPEKLLCLTYTRSAAAEMKERLFTLLAEWALLDDGELSAAIAERLGATADDPTQGDMLARARKLFAQALETPGGLRVQTIHSFCESVLKRFPLEAGLSPQFDLMDDQQAVDMQRQILQRLLRHPPNQELAEAMALLTRQLAEPDILRLTQQIIDQRAHFSGQDSAAQLHALARAAQKANGDDMTGHMPEPDDIITAHAAAHHDTMRRLADLFAGSGSTSDEQQSDRIHQWLVLAQAGRWQEGWQALGQVFFTGAGKTRARLATKALLDDPAFDAALQQWRDAFVKDMARYRSAVGLAFTRALLHFGHHLIAGYNEEKARRALLDYDDLISRTNALLTGKAAAAWVLYKIDGGLEHILVDEAQDTSPAQWRVIGALAEEFFAGEGAMADTALAKGRGPRTLFAVGDEKQSIFSFQGADPRQFVEQFAHFKEAVTQSGGEMDYVPLTLSRRSAPQILQFVDAVFAGAAGDGLTGMDDGPVRHEAHRSEACGYVELWPVAHNPEKPPEAEAWDVPMAQQMAQQAETGRRQLARRMADKISDLVRQPDIEPGDILILVRKRDGFVDEMMRALKQRNLPVAGADRMHLLEQICVQDVLAAARFALNTEDDLSLACLLKSPLCGLDDDALFALAHGRSGTLWQAVKNAGEDMAAICALLDWLVTRIDYIPPFDFFAQLLGARGGMARLAARLGPEISDPLGELMRLALSFEQQNTASMQGFLHWLEQGEQQIKRDMEARGDAIRIMTVHGAKGLEAPIVFLPDTCGRGVPTSSARTPFLLDADNVPLWQAGQLLRDSYTDKQKQRSDADTLYESRRLLYVALTRARDRLYIGGHCSYQNIPDDCWYGMISAALAQPQYQSEQGEDMLWRMGDEAKAGPFAKDKSQKDKDETDTPNRSQDAAPHPAVPEWCHHAPVPDKLATLAAMPKSSATKRPQQEADPARAAAAMRGTLAHRLFELLPPLPVARRLARGLAYLDGQVSDWSQEARAALCADVLAVMDKPELAALFGSQARAEAAICGVLETDNGARRMENRQIDRFVETESGIFIADFKTGTPPDSAAQIAADYIEQMAVYQALMRAAKPDVAVTCALIWTRNGQVDMLTQSQLDAALAAYRARS